MTGLGVGWQAADETRGMRAGCPHCGRFLAWQSCGAIVDVLTIPGVDVIRDVANCGKCGLVEYQVRPISAAFWDAS